MARSRAAYRLNLGGRYARSLLFASVLCAGSVGCSLADSPRDSPPLCPEGAICPPPKACPGCEEKGSGEIEPTGAIAEAPISDGPWARGGALGFASRGTGPTTAPAVVWEVEIGAVITGAAALSVSAEGELAAFVGSHAGRFVGVTIGGARAGQIALDLSVPGIIGGSAAVDASGRLYVGADDDTLYAIDPRARSIVWSLRLGGCEPARAPGPEGVRCDADGGPTLGPGGDLWVGADGIYRVDREGQIRWRFPDPKATPRALHVFAAPLVGRDGSAYFGGWDGSFTAIDGDGALRWQIALGPDVDAAPIMLPNGVVVVGADDGAILAFDQAGAERWRFKAGGEVRAPLALTPEGVIIAASMDGTLYALAADGALRWSFSTRGPLAAAPAIDAAGNIFFGSRDEHVYAVDGRGRSLWALALPEDVDAAVTIAADGSLIVGCDDGVLRALR
jgi:outer membrane protein assembly factor BamB